MIKTVGVIGCGIMGGAMAANLAKGGFAVVGTDVRPEPRAALAAAGVAWAETAAEAAERAEVVITSLPSAAALDAVAAELAGGDRPGLIVVECSTLPLADKERARVRLDQAGIILLDCPLSGTGAQAKVKDLAVYASGDEAAYQRCRPVFPGFGRVDYYLGAFGNGSRMKFVANLLVAIHNLATAEAFTLGIKAGLDPELLFKVIGDGAGTSRVFQLRGPMMVAGDYSEATMRVSTWQKDMKVIGDFAAGLGCPTPLFATSAPYYNAAMGQGHGDHDTASVCAVLEAMAGLSGTR